MPLFDTTVGAETTTGLVTYIGQVLQAVLGWIPNIFSTMMDSPVVLLFICLAVVGTAVAFARKILK